MLLIIVVVEKLLNKCVVYCIYPCEPSFFSLHECLNGEWCTSVLWNRLYSQRWGRCIRTCQVNVRFHAHALLPSLLASLCVCLKLSYSYSVYKLKQLACLIEKRTYSHFEMAAVCAINDTVQTAHSFKPSFIIFTYWTGLCNKTKKVLGEILT